MLTRKTATTSVLGILLLPIIYRLRYCSSPSCSPSRNPSPLALSPLPSLSMHLPPALTLLPPTTSQQPPESTLTWSSTNRSRITTQSPDRPFSSLLSLFPPHPLINPSTQLPPPSSPPSYLPSRSLLPTANLTLVPIFKRSPFRNFVCREIPNENGTASSSAVRRGLRETGWEWMNCIWPIR
jgi:hypothetical protein